ncbi:MAG: glycosyltransferase family 9 protein [Candidatus Dadabacteria bacterium]|nr:MAG: glycosyltransferase family 9 protein [Candidatus Dadabacteria bacterium]
MNSGIMKRRYPEKDRVLLVNITRLGDMLQATPTIAGMKMENPDCKITVLVEKQFEGICNIIPNIDEIVGIDLGMTVRSLAREQDGIIDAYEYVSEVVDDLRIKNFDYCLNMSSSAYTAILLNLLGIKRRGGWASDEEGYRVIESEWARLFATSVFHQNRQFNSLNLVDVFRCSADVEQHPKKLLVDVPQDASDYIDNLLREAAFTTEGPLIAVQAGASQGKRQWATEKFIELIDHLTYKYKARVVLTGTKKELPIIEPIKAGCRSENVFVVAGRTNLPQLAALLQKSAILVTGDTGPMHMSVAVGTPVVSMFLASAYGYETGPYSEGNLILQPVIECGPCNPNKDCARPDCHDQIDPQALAELVAMRIERDVKNLPQGLFDPARVIVYRSFFDQFGFCDLESINTSAGDPWQRYRNAYRKLWLDDLGGFPIEQENKPETKILQVAEEFPGINEITSRAEKGRALIDRLLELIRDTSSEPRLLGQVSEKLSELDREIEQIGYHFAPLGPLTRMFIFAKENLSGTDAAGLASQMGRVYDDLKRRSRKLVEYY